ncbi:MAG: IclR family transcriptional regulator [Pigmentiphaga sp.]
MSKSALRVLEIMEFIAGYPNGCNHTTIARGLRIPKSSLTVLLQNLQSKGYVERHPDTGFFTIGLQVLWLANSYLRNLNLVKLGQPVVAELFTHINQFTALAIPSGSEYVIICTESTPSAFGHTLYPGSRGSLSMSAFGKAILAWSSRAYQEEVAAFSGTTTEDKETWAQVYAELESTRGSGVARSRGEAIAGVDGFAAAVFNANTLPVAALGVGVPTAQLTLQVSTEIESALLVAARKLSMQLGWQGVLPSL